MGTGLGNGLLLQRAFTEANLYTAIENVGRSEFISCHERHLALITWVVGPLMLVEIGSAGLLLHLGERSLGFVVSLIPLAVVWASTGFLQIPLHQKLTQGDDIATLDGLVSTNMWRTFAWTLRGLCLAMQLILMLR
jgi:hypothetical protein